MNFSEKRKNEATQLYVISHTANKLASYMCDNGIAMLNSTWMLMHRVTLCTSQRLILKISQISLAHGC